MKAAAAYTCGTGHHQYPGRPRAAEADSSGLQTGVHLTSTGDEKAFPMADDCYINELEDNALVCLDGLLSAAVLSAAL